MGLFDNIVLPEDFNLPEFPANPRYKENKTHHRLWQTKDLLCGQDRYRLRKFDTNNNNGTHQLERRVPPIQKMTAEGNKIMDEDNLLWWNIVRPSGNIEITSNTEDKLYTYNLDIFNGVLKNVTLVDIQEI